MTTLIRLVAVDGTIVAEKGHTFKSEEPCASDTIISHKGKFYVWQYGDLEDTLEEYHETSVLELP